MLDERITNKNKPQIRTLVRTARGWMNPTQPTAQKTKTRRPEEVEKSVRNTLNRLGLQRDEAAELLRDWGRRERNPNGTGDPTPLGFRMAWWLEELLETNTP